MISTFSPGIFISLFVFFQSLFIQGGAEPIEQFKGVTACGEGVRVVLFRSSDIPISELNQTDFVNRQNLCENMLGQIAPEAAFFSSDEAHFHVCGAVNKQNFRYWAKSNPQIIQEIPLHSHKLTVWCAISQFGVIGPYFFEEDGVTVTVNSERYVALLQNYLQPRMEEIIENEGLGVVRLQHYGATAHTVWISLNILIHVSRTCGVFEG